MARSQRLVRQLACFVSTFDVSVWIDLTRNDDDPHLASEAATEARGCLPFSCKKSFISPPLLCICVEPFVTLARSSTRTPVHGVVARRNGSRRWEPAAAAAAASPSPPSAPRSRMGPRGRRRRRVALLQAARRRSRRRCREPRRGRGSPHDRQRASAPRERHRAPLPGAERAGRGRGRRGGWTCGEKRSSQRQEMWCSHTFFFVFFFFDLRCGAWVCTLAHRRVARISTRSGTNASISFERSVSRLRGR